jgi:hypothetical protein
MTFLRLGRRTWTLPLAGGLAATVIGVAPARAAVSAPTVLGETATHIEQNNARLRAAIETGDAETTYEFWLIDPCPEPQECIRDIVVAHGTLHASTVAKHRSVELAAGEGGPNIEPDTTYEYWVTARNAHGGSEGAHQTFKTLPPGQPPSILREFVGKVGETNAVLHSEIDPGALATEYQFWIADPCPPPSECIRDVLLKHGTIPDVLSPRNVRVELATAEGSPNIEPGTSYEYWVTATNAAGSRTVRKVFTTSG